jgi:O-acetyl-ADP-ribose deacetylase (regulator of RNase III)
MINIVEGNILDANEDIIAHQVNCQKVMGSGLAKQIRNKYPQVFTEYKWVLDNFGSQLGHCQLVSCNDSKTIANLFSQDRYGTDRRYTDYDYLKQSLQQLLRMANENEFSIAIPYNLGCGLAGGNWDIVYKIIEDVFQDYDVTIYKLV